MPIAADCHVHLYPAFDEGLVFSAALRRLGEIAPGASRAIVLAERSECGRFTELLKGDRVPAGFAVDALDEISLKLSDGAGQNLMLVAGRQIATAERLEVLSLFSSARIPDGLSFDETVKRTAESGAMPVITWAPGKWSGARGGLVRRILDSKTCPALFLCDTTLRPVGWPTPAAFRAAAERGIKILAGSDPLPMKGEELQTGRFGIVVRDGDARSGGELRRLIESSDITIAGHRNDPARWAVRYARYMLEKRR